VWDTIYVCPDKLQEVIFQQVMQYLGVNRQIREDENPNSQQGA